MKKLYPYLYHLLEMDDCRWECYLHALESLQ